MCEIVLALDTATDDSALAIGERSGATVRVLAEFDFSAPRAALARLVPAISEALSERDLNPTDISEVVVGRGPGSFTGVRIGVATAKGIAQGLDVALYGVGTLDAVAWRVLPREGLLGVVGDAMRGEVYPALFELRADRVLRMTQDRVADPACVALEWASELEGRGVMLAGNGLRKYAAVFAEALGPQAEVLPEQAWHPGGRGVLRAFGEALRAGAAGDGEPGSLLPIYTRLSDAEEGERIRAGRAGSAPPRSGVNGAPEPGPRPEGGSR